MKKETKKGRNVNRKNFQVTSPTEEKISQKTGMRQKLAKKKIIRERKKWVKERNGWKKEK